MQNIHMLQLFSYVFYLNGNNKIGSSVKPGIGLCISSYKNIYLR